MKFEPRMWLPRFFLLLLALSAQNLFAQSWSGIIGPSRAVNWSNAGVVGGIPSGSWTQCGSTIAVGASAATINSAIQNCAASHFVLLGPGTFNLNTGIVLKSGVVLRGAGADQTFLVFTGNNGCGGAYATICIEGGTEYFGSSNVQPGGSNAANWTAGYVQGTNQITLSGIGGSGIAVGQYLYLDQADDTAPNGGLFVCETTSSSCSLEGGSGDPGRVVGGIARNQVQIVRVTAINGSTYTISPGVYAPNWSASKTPGAWWPSSIIQNAGIENLSVDATNSGGNANVTIQNAANVWVKGTRQVRSCQCSRSIIQMDPAIHTSIVDNYIYGTQGMSTNYGVESYLSSDNLVQNNVFQHVVVPMMLHSNQGSVYAFNYAINDTYDDGSLHYMSNAIAGHSAGVMYNLFEGNVGPGLGADAFHGNQVLNTAFRNYFLGSDPGRTDATIAINLLSYSRYYNIIGNVLGTPGYTSTYSGSSAAVYALGSGNSNGSVTVPNDPLVASTIMRWGNYDVVNGTNRFVASEVPTGISTYPNPLPSTQTLPASFFLPGMPTWWPSAKAWPPIGPDVTGGNVANLGGRVNTLPAQDCYLNVMKGPNDGSGSVLNFNAGNCYSSSGSTTTPPSAPSGLSAAAN